MEVLLTWELERIWKMANKRDPSAVQWRLGHVDYSFLCVTDILLQNYLIFNPLAMKNMN